MQFLTPIFWMAAAGVGLPLILHLIRRERSRELLFSSLRFLRPATRKTFRYLKIRNPWILLLRVLLILLLVAAFARPYAPDRAEVVSGLAPHSATVILLDCSRSMVLQQGWEEALRRIENFLGEMRGQDEAALVAFADAPLLVSEWTRDAGVLRSLLAARARPTFRTTDYASALRVADKMLSERAGTTKKLLLVSDFQKTGFRSDQDFRLSSGIHLELIRVGDREKAPVGIVDAHLTFSGAGSARVGKVAARMLNLSRLPRSAEVSLLLNGQVETVKTIAFEKDPLQFLEFDGRRWPEGSTRCELRVRTSGTDSFFLTAEGSSREMIAIVEGVRPRPERPASYYLARAMTSGEDAAFAVQAVGAGRFGELDLNAPRTLFLLGVDDLPAASVQRLKQAVEGGRGLVLVCSGTLQPQVFNRAFADLAPAVLGEAVRRTREPLGVMGHIKMNHPIFRLFAESQTGNFLAPRYSGYFSSTPHPSAEIVARFDDGRPAILLRQLGRGRVILFTSSLDNSWNDLPLSPLYLPLVYQMAQHAGSIEGRRKWYWIGESADLSADLSFSRTGSENPVVSVEISGSGEPGKTIRENAYIFEQPGIHAFRQQARLQYRAANVRPEELDLTPLDSELFHAQVTDPKTSPSASAAAAAGAGEKAPLREFWPYVVVVALALAAFETLAANRLERKPS